MDLSAGYNTTQRKQQKDQPIWLDFNGIISPVFCSPLAPEKPKAQPATKKQNREIRARQVEYKGVQEIHKSQRQDEDAKDTNR